MRVVKRYPTDASFQPLSIAMRQKLEALCVVARRLDATEKALPATSGNFSVRIDSEHFLISRSGLHKRHLTPKDFIRTNLLGRSLHPLAPKPSDETLLHAMVYRNAPEAQAVLHCHAPRIDTLQPPGVTIREHELLKAMGHKTHESVGLLHVFPNSQDIRHLSHEIGHALFSRDADKDALPAFILERHGIYCYGSTVQAAANHLEAVLHLIAVPGNL